MKVKPTKNIHLGSVKGNKGSFSDTIEDGFANYFLNRTEKYSAQRLYTIEVDKLLVIIKDS